jgi:hypothetical protein
MVNTDTDPYQAFIGVHRCSSVFIGVHSVVQMLSPTPEKVMAIDCLPSTDPFLGSSLALTYLDGQVITA